jgi:type I restriction enzyme S subunit
MTNEWVETTLGDVVQIMYGKDHKHLQNGLIPVYGSGGIMRYADRSLFEDESILIPRKGTLNNIIYVNKPCWTVDTMFWTKINKSKAYPKFIFYQLMMINFVELNVGSAVPSLTVPVLNNIPLLLPPLPVQRRIADILGTLDDKIELNRRMNATLEEMARALFKAWFVDFEPVRAKLDGRWQRGQSLPGLPAHLYDLFPDQLVDSELGEIPQGWGVGKVGDVVELAYGKPLKSGERVTGKFGVYGSNGLVGYHHQKLVDGPGIIIGRKGTAGKVTWVNDDFYPIDTSFYAIPIDYLSKHYLFFMLSNLNLSNLSADSAVPGLNRHDAYAQDCVLPSEFVMYEFDKSVQKWHQLIHTNDKNITSLTTLRDTLLPKLLSGEVEV